MSDGFWGEDGSELKLGGDEDNDGRGILNDSADIVTDFGKDVAWAGESIYDTAGATAGALESDTVDGAKDFASDVAGLHPIDALEDLGGIAWNDAGDLVEGVGMMGGEALIGVGAGALAAMTDVISVGGDIVDDIGDGIKDVVGSDVINDVEDAGSAVEDGLLAAGGFLGNFEENLPDYIETGVVDGAEAVGEGVADAAEAVGSGVEDAAEAVGDAIEDLASDIADIF
jgi:hypothetical protein